MTQGLSLDIAVPLDRFTLSVAWETEVSFLGIFGHSGSGKTTVLETIAGLRPGAQGRVAFGGETWLDSMAGVRLPPEARGVGYVPQDGLLFPHLDVTGNLMAGRRRAARAGRGLEPERVIRLLELGGIRRRRVDALSGGEKQRVALGRALLSGPGLLLLDEPLAGLDLPLRRRILPYLLRVHDELAIPTVYVSHDATELRMLSDEVAVLSGGRIVARGRPGEIFTDPAVLPLAAEEGFENVLTGRVLETDGGTATVEIEEGSRVLVPGHGLAAGRLATLSVGAGDLIVAVATPVGLSAQNAVAGVIREIRGPMDQDGALMVVVDVGLRPTPMVAAITLRASRHLGLQPGRPVHLVFKVQACRVLASR